jgi:hypothetical protein
MFRISIRELLLVMVIVGLAVAWWRDRRSFDTRLDLARLQAKILADSGRVPLVVGNARPQSLDHFPFPSSNTHSPVFVAFVAAGSDDLGNVAGEAMRARHTPFADESAQQLAAMLSDSDAGKRTRAAIALGYMAAQGSEAIPLLIVLLDDASPDVRFHAMSALSVYRQEAQAAVPALRKIMDGDSGLAALAGKCIGMIDPQQDLGPRFRQLLASRHRNNRFIAVGEVSYYYPPDEAENILADAFRYEKDKGIREGIARAVNRLP